MNLYFKIRRFESAGTLNYSARRMQLYRCVDLRATAHMQPAKHEPKMCKSTNPNRMSQ
jgi:hypothetical protein